LAAICVLAATLVAASLTKRFLARVQPKGHFSFLLPLLPSVASLLYIIGFKIVVEVAPLRARPQAWLDGTIYVVTVWILLSLARRAAIMATEWGVARASVSPTLQQGFVPLMRNLISIFIFAMGSIMLLKHFDYDVMSIITALGVGSLAIGLAAKDTLANMISGFTLIIDRNLTPGDRINLGGMVGDVEEVGLRSTRLRMGDGNTLIVPNSELVNTKILNLSLPSREGLCTSTFKVPYTETFEKIRAICLAALEELATNPECGLSQAKKPAVLLSNLADGAQTITVSFWISDMNDAGNLQSAFNANALERMRREGVTLIRVIQ
jgi:small-conductance mechanosensitive channel